ncbi:hypothetical protein G6F22_012918 [Rhizopus arrhizus]|nr:hypothetical protein G6F22_012918 [Rhizopus arrhizus]KAG1199298.1 hypothetical protein G6F35_012525 [Rhizopus arrhizus]
MKKSIILSLICLVSLGFGQDTIETSDDSISSNDLTPTTTTVATATFDSTTPTNSDIPSSSDNDENPTTSSSIPTPTDADTLTIKPSSTVESESSIPTATHKPYIPPTVKPSVCHALQTWYNSLNGKGWIVSTGWDSSNMTSCCTWYNVHCNSVGKVLKVDLSHNNLTGHFPNNFDQIPDLQNM